MAGEDGRPQDLLVEVLSSGGVGHGGGQARSHGAASVHTGGRGGLARVRGRGWPWRMPCAVRGDAAGMHTGGRCEATGPWAGRDDGHGGGQVGSDGGRLAQGHGIEVAGRRFVETGKTPEDGDRAIEEERED
jgi:hypothetical protein